MLEPTFQQDLNGNGHIGLVTTTIESFGVTHLDEVGNQYFLRDSGGAGPSLKYAGAAFFSAAWQAIAAEQTAGGYEVVFKNGGADLYTAWNLDGAGNYLGNALGYVAGADIGLRALEPTFQQDLNGDNQIGSLSNSDIQHFMSASADISSMSASETTFSAETTDTLLLLLAAHRHDL
jgi:serralysin